MPPAAPQTLSGATFFMHGIGVFDYASLGTTKTQVYLAPYADCDKSKLLDGDCLTFISAIAIESGDNLLTFRSNSLWVNGKQHNSQETFSVGAANITGAGSKFGAPVERVNHEDLAYCHKVGVEAPEGWFWENCTSSGWTIRTPEMTLEIGAVGPYEKGWLNEKVSTRTFNIQVRDVLDSQKANVQGVINGDRNGYFIDDPDHTYYKGTKKVVHPGDKEVRANNVPSEDQIFPAEVRQDMEKACGSMVKAVTDAKAGAKADASNMRLIRMGQTSQKRLFLRRAQSAQLKQEQTAGSSWP